MKKNSNNFSLLPSALLAFTLFMSAVAYGQHVTTLDFAPKDGVAVEYSYLKQLVSDVHPTIFYNPENRYLWGDDNFLIVETTPSKVDQLYLEDPLFSTVELLRIRISSPEEQFILNLGQLTTFAKLQYVQFIFLYKPCGEETDNECLYNTSISHVIAGNSYILVMYQYIDPED